MPDFIVQQRIAIKYGGAVVGKDERRLVDYLRKKSEIDKAVVTRRSVPDERLMRESIKFMREYTGVMDIPTDEDGLVDRVIQVFTDKREHYRQLLSNYDKTSGYPEEDCCERCL